MKTTGLVTTPPPPQHSALMCLPQRNLLRLQRRQCFFQLTQIFKKQPFHGSQKGFPILLFEFLQEEKQQVRDG